MILFIYVFLFQSLKLLSVLAAIRLDVDDYKIGDTLVLALVDKKDTSKSISAQDPLASSTWEEVVLPDVSWMYLDLKSCKCIIQIA